MCSFFMQDCSEGDSRAALSNNGCAKFVNFTILFEKPIACQSVGFSRPSVTISCYRPVYVLQLHVILVVNNCCVSLLVS